MLNNANTENPERKPLILSERLLKNIQKLDEAIELINEDTKMVK